MQNSGHDHAFSEFVIQYQERLYRLIYRMINDVEAARDILQDTLLAGYEHIDRLTGQSSLYTYFYRIALNKSISYLRKKKIRQWNPIEMVERFLADPKEDALNSMIHGENEDRIQNVINRLPSRQKAIFISRVNEELSFKEIAEMLKITGSAARSNFFQALQKIKKEFRHE